jgi:hypothetical protein
MKNISLAGRSMALFGLSILILIAATLAESSLGVMSLTVQRIVTLLGFVLPAGLGCALGVLSWVRKEGHPWLASAGVVLNGLFALFHILIVLLAG